MKFDSWANGILLPKKALSDPIIIHLCSTVVVVVMCSATVFVAR